MCSKFLSFGSVTSYRSALPVYQTVHVCSRSISTVKAFFLSRLLTHSLTNSKLPVSFSLQISLHSRPSRPSRPLLQAQALRFLPPLHHHSHKYIPTITLSSHSTLTQVRWPKYLQSLTHGWRCSCCRTSFSAIPISLGLLLPVIFSSSPCFCVPPERLLFHQLRVKI